MIDPRLLDRLDERLGSGKARRRLVIETYHERQIARHRLKSLHREHWFSHPNLIRTVLWLTGLYARGRRNAARVVIRRNTVQCENLPPAFDGFKILHVSDLHTDNDESFVARLAPLIRSCSYDLCLMTGDYRGATFGDCAAALRGMAALFSSLNAPALAVTGNHDSLEMIPALESFGIRVLLNETEAIDRAGERIFIAGIDDAHFFRTHDISRTTATIPKHAFSILLSHTPEVFREAEQSGFNLMLSGHTHGGQICLPGGVPITLSARLPRRFGAGAWRYGKMHGYTSAGAGTSIVPVRFNCPPEITVHELRRVTAR